MNYLDPNPCLRVSVGALQTKTGVFPALSQLFLGQKVKVLVAQLCWTLCDPMDCSLSGSSVHGILQERILEWGATCHSVLQGIFLTQGLISGLLH